MRDWRLFIPLVVLLCITVAYIIEVILGSRPGMYNAELGRDVHCGKRTRLSYKEFFFRYLPIMLGVAGLLFLLAQLSY
jgi:hypothetical protein